MLIFLGVGGILVITQKPKQKSEYDEYVYKRKMAELHTKEIEDRAEQDYVDEQERRENLRDLANEGLAKRLMFGKKEKR